MLWILCGWFLINLLTFLIWGIDKWKARTGRWRIREQTLLWFSVFGGWLGAILAIEVFKHKTIKSSFLWKFYGLAFLWIVLFFGMWFLLG
ncbi:MAG: DUF1294 domain-containing protein [candidate division SR1 bacterium]|nr:MAG: DUF1294 domain-containing protein [candidate division SR1 bacterium]